MTTPTELLELAREVAGEAGRAPACAAAGRRRRPAPRARRLVEVEPDRSRHRHRPRQRGPDRRFACCAPGRTTASWARKAAPARARPASPGSSTRSTAPSTTSTASRSSPCRSRLRSKGASVAGVVHNPVTRRDVRRRRRRRGVAERRRAPARGNRSAARRGARGHRFLLPGAAPGRSGTLAPDRPPRRPRHPAGGLGRARPLRGGLRAPRRASTRRGSSRGTSPPARSSRGRPGPRSRSSRGSVAGVCDRRGRRPRAGSRVDRAARACRLRLRVSPARRAGSFLLEPILPAGRLSGPNPPGGRLLASLRSPSRPRRR